jgi:hypothetical protein
MNRLILNELFCNGIGDFIIEIYKIFIPKV